MGVAWCPPPIAVGDTSCGRCMRDQRADRSGWSRPVIIHMRLPLLRKDIAMLGRQPALVAGWTEGRV